MPTYEFRCKSGHDFEQFHRTMSSAPSEVACPQCGETAERRISGGAGLMFKGSGFYITDYGKDGKKSQRSSSGSAESGSASGGESKSADAGGKAEAKPEAKSESKSEPKPAAKPSTSGGE